MEILFVCSGNTCRSAMAEGIFKKLIEENGILNICVSSAGVIARNGVKASENAIQVCSDFGIYISEHKSRTVNKDIFEESDLILCMTRLHKQYLEIIFGENNEKLHTLCECCYPKTDFQDILDPYDGDIEVYRACFNQLYSLIGDYLIKLL